MNWLKSFGVFLFLVNCTTHVFGHRLGFEWLNEKNGLSNNLIMDLHQDREGFLWIATINGLNRYDGYRFTHFFYHESDSASLPGSRVSSLSEDSKGRLWIGTSNGIAVYDPQNEKITRIDMQFENDFKEVLDILCDSRNRVWVCSEAGVYLIDHQGKRLGFWTGDGRRDSMPFSSTYKAEEDPWGNIWILSKCGLAQFLEADQQFKVYSTYHLEFLGKQQTCTAPTAAIFPNQQEIICGSWASGLLRFNRNTGKYVNYLHAPEFKGEGAFNLITGLGWFDQKLYLASHDKGLGWFDTLTHTFTYLRDLGFENLPLPTMQTSRLLITGPILWAGTTDGLFKLDLRTQMVDVFRFNHIRQGDCLPDIHHVTPVGKTGDSLSVASWTCGMWMFDKQSQKLTSQGITSELFFKSHLNLDFWMSYEDSRGTYWYPCSHGLFRKDKNQTEVFILVPPQPGLSKENYFTRVVEDKFGNIWAGSLDGILFFEKGGRTYIKYRVKDLVPNAAHWLSNQITDIDVAGNGDLWFTCNAAKNTAHTGLLIHHVRNRRYDWKTQNPSAPDGHLIPQCKFYDLLIDRRGKFWIASSTGIRIYQNSAFRQVKHLTTSGGLFSDQVQALTEDQQGKIWALYENGFETDFIDAESFAIIRIGNREGLPNALTTSIQAGKNREIYIGFNRNWLGIYRPDLQQEYQQTHPARVTGVLLDGRPVSIQSVLRIKGDHHLVELEFSPMNLLRTDLLKFEVLVEGAETPYRYQPEGNRIILNGLKPGNHRIKLLMWNSLNRKKYVFPLMEVSVEPMWYQATWFKVLMLLCLMGITASGAFWLSARIQKQKRLKSERERELESLKLKALRAQMNPHFIFNALNSINRFIWDNKAEEASAYLSNFAKLTRLILEHTREEWISLREDLAALELYLKLEALRLGKHMKFEIDPDPDLDLAQVLIPPMLIQPFAENAIKHAFSESGKDYVLQIRLRKNANHLVVEIEDNGAGRNLNKKIGHKSLSSRIVQDRLKMIEHGGGNMAQIHYFDKTNNEGLPTGTIVRFEIPYLIDKNIKNESD